MIGPQYHPVPVADFHAAGCAGKDALTRQQAKQIADRMSWARKGKTAAIPYRCEHCGGWHIGARR